MTFFLLFLKKMFISVARSGWLEGSVSMSSLQSHFLQTLEHRTDVSVTSTSPRWGAPEERGAPRAPTPAPAGTYWGQPCVPTLPPGLAVRGLLGTAGTLQPPWGSPFVLSQPVPVPLGSETFGCAAQNPLLSCAPARMALWSKRGDGLMCWPFSNPVCPNLNLLVSQN